MTGLLDLPTELLTHIFLLAFHSYRSGLWRTRPSGEKRGCERLCVCQACAPYPYGKRRINAAIIPLNPLYILTRTCKKLSQIANTLLYDDVALVRQKSIKKFARTLIQIPTAAAGVQKLIIVGGGPRCLSVHEILRESPAEFILAKCRAVKEIRFEDVRGLPHVMPEEDSSSPLNTNPWPRVFSILATLPQLTSLGFEDCDVDLEEAPTLPSITNLRFSFETHAFNDSLGLFPSFRHLTVSGDPSYAFFDEDLEFLAPAPEVVIEGPKSPKEILGIVGRISSCHTLSFSLVDTFATRDYRSKSRYRLARHVPKPVIEKLYITLCFFDWVTTRERVLIGLSKFLRTLDSPSVHLTLHLSDDQVFPVAPSEMSIIKRIKAYLGGVKELEIVIAEMDFTVEEEDDE